MLTTVEKVIILQEVDVFEHLFTEDLAKIAGISEPVTYAKGTVIFEEGGYPNSMYLVLNGKVDLTQNGKLVMAAVEKDSFGMWALFDDQPRVVTASVVEDCNLLRIDKDDFYDVLADNIGITQGILKALVHKVRGLMAKVT